ncbi:MAG TPA: LuxR C-terminal-related transcriptional regulator [Conexibacter sp.]|jgi:DNA-binding CsgD family transcriptional regulator
MGIDTRAALTREAVDRLSRADLSPQELLHEAATRIRRAVAFDFGAWVTLDPDTLLPTCNVRFAKPDNLIEGFWDNELLTPDVHKFSELASRRSPVATMATADPEARDKSTRRKLIHERLGVGDEARVMLRLDRTTWGAGCLYRDGGARDFDEHERQFLGEVSIDLAQGLRRSLAGRRGTAVPIETVGVVTLDHELNVLSSTAEASRMLAQMPDDARTTVRAVAIRTRASGGGADDGPRHVRVQLDDGSWIRLQAEQLKGDADEQHRVAVIIDRAPRTDVVSLTLRLHGISRREREVAQLLVTGMPTDAIAARLQISRHTLRDHVKAIFAKLGVSSRSELTARIAGDNVA